MLGSLEVRHNKHHVTCMYLSPIFNTFKTHGGFFFSPEKTMQFVYSFPSDYSGGHFSSNDDYSPNKVQYLPSLHSEDSEDHTVT